MSRPLAPIGDGGSLTTTAINHGGTITVDDAGNAVRVVNDTTSVIHAKIIGSAGGTAGTSDPAIPAIGDNTLLLAKGDETTVSIHQPGTGPGTIYAQSMLDNFR